MPQLVQLQEKLRDQGFVIVGNHVQNGTKDEVVGLVRRLKVNFTITSFSRIDVPEKGSGIPRAYLFNSRGELVEKGHPASMKKSIEDLVASEPHWLAAGREYEELAAVADALKKVKGRYSAILKRLAREAKKDGDAKEEAEYLLKRIRGHGRDLLERAKALESEDAFGAHRIYEQVAMGWKGDEVGDQASDRLKALKRDKTFQKELKAGAYADAIRQEFKNLIPNPRDGKIRLEERANRKTALKIRKMFALLKSKYEETKAFSSIQRELEKYEA